MAKSTKTLIVITILVLCFAFANSNQETAAESTPGCQSESAADKACHNKSESLKLKIVAILSILFASMIGVCLPLFAPKVPALRPDKDLFVVVKAFASGVILATGYMHVLPDSFNDLTSDCLPEFPWKKFPFSTFVAMLSAVATLMVDSFMMSKHVNQSGSVENRDEMLENGVRKLESGGNDAIDNTDVAQELLRRQITAQVLEAGIIVHSVVIGLAMGATDNQCTIKPLVIAICFHQLFEGMGLGGCILQGEFPRKTQAAMVFFFSSTTPFGIALGIGLSNVYSETSPTALIVVGLLNACSAGLLNYMALVDLLAADFLGPRLLGKRRLQSLAFVAVILGALGMSVMAFWA